MLLIKNGRVIDPAGKKERNADIVVKDGKIEKIYPEGTLPAEAEAAANQVLDAKGLVVAPGLQRGYPHRSSSCCKRRFYYRCVYGKYKANRR